MTKTTKSVTIDADGAKTTTVESTTTSGDGAAAGGGGKAGRMMLNSVVLGGWEKDAPKVFLPTLSASKSINILPVHSPKKLFIANDWK